MKESNREDFIIDDSEFLEKDLERQAAKKYLQHRNEEFEREADEGKFKVISQVAETIGAVFVFIWILYELWTSLSGIWGKLLVILIVLAAVSSIVFRYIARHYYFKGDRKKFKVFNTASKVTEVSLNMADTFLPGDKTIAKIEKTQGAVAKVISSGNRVSALDDDNTMYSSDNYDVYRRRCQNKGIEVDGQNRVEAVIKATKNKLREARLSVDDRRDIILIIFIVNDYKRDLVRDVIPEAAYYELLGSLEAFSNTGIRNNLIPNFIPGYGYIDDMFMCNCVLSEFRDEIKAYRVWRAKYKAMKSDVTNKEYLNAIEGMGKRAIQNRTVRTILSLYEEGEEQCYAADLFHEMWEAKDCGRFSMDERTEALIVGALAYWEKEEDYIPDSCENGKYDDKAVLHIVYQEIWKECERYRNGGEPINGVDDAISKMLNSYGREGDVVGGTE